MLKKYFHCSHTLKSNEILPFFVHYLNNVFYFNTGKKMLQGSYHLKKKSDFKETVNGVPYYFYIKIKLHLPGFPLEKLTFIKSQTT